MLRKILSLTAVALFLGITLAPDPADARRGGGGYRGGGGHAVRMHGGAGRYAHVSRPIARPGARAAYRAGAYRGARYGAYRGYGRGAAVGAAAVGAAAVGSAYYRRGCGYDSYGNWVCPGYYPY
jgi:hypothetical protein